MKYTSVAVTTAIVAVFLFGTPYAQQDATAAAAIAAGGKVDDAAAHRHRNRDSHSEEWYRSHSGSRSGSHSEEHDRHHDEFPASYAPNDRHGRFPGSYAPHDEFPASGRPVSHSGSHSDSGSASHSGSHSDEYERGSRSGSGTGSMSGSNSGSHSEEHDRHHDEFPGTYSPNNHYGMNGEKKDDMHGNNMAAKHDEHRDEDQDGDNTRKVGALLILIGAVAALVGLLTFIGCCIRNKCCKKKEAVPMEKIVVGTEFTQEDIAQAKVAAAVCDGIVVTDKTDVTVPIEPVAIVVPQEKEQPAPLPESSL